MHSPLLTALAVLLVARSPLCVVADPGRVSISAPDIYPDVDDGTIYLGDVTISLVNNAPNAFLVYTADGSDPTNTSTSYQGPFTIFRPGSVTIMARAYPVVAGATTSRSASVTSRRTYVIVAGTIPAPMLNPPHGYYRGSQVVSLAPPQELGSNGQKLVLCYEQHAAGSPVGEWKVAPDDATVATVTLPAPGSFIVSAALFDSKKCELKRSAKAEHKYVLAAPLVYDVSTECQLCAEGKPTIGEPFTVWLQNVWDSGTMFLTTSSKGCSGRTHTVDGTGPAVVTPFKPYAHFVSIDDADYFHVCLREGSDPSAPFVLVPRRRAATLPMPCTAPKMSPSPHCYSLQKAIRADFVAVTNAPGHDHEEATSLASAEPPSGPSGGLTFGLLVILLMLVGLVWWIVRLLRIKAHVATAVPRQLQRRAASEPTESEERANRS